MSMTVKKYPQSHLLITGESAGRSTKIIIDPGYVTFEGGFKVEEFQGMDVYLITHQHADHMDPERIREIVGDGKIYGNADVVDKLKGLGIQGVQVNDRQKFTVGEFEITPVDLPHCKMQDGLDGPPNTGYLIKPAKGEVKVLFHPGDGDKAPQGLTSKNVALPIAGPSITYEGALKFAQDIAAKVVIPIHYDSRFAADPDQFKMMAQPGGIEVRILNPGEALRLRSG